MDPALPDFSMKRAFLSEREADSDEVIDLKGMQLAFPPAIHVQEAAKQTIAEGLILNGPSTIEQHLRDALVRQYGWGSGIAIESRHIHLSGSRQQIIANALHAILQTGDEVLIPVPSDPAHADLVKKASGVPVFVACGAASNHKLTAVQLDEAITSRTKAVILSCPTCLSGDTYSKSEIAGLVSVLQRHPHVLLVSDETFLPFQYFDEDSLSFSAVALPLKAAVLSVSDVFMTCAMRGGELGLGVGPSSLIEAMRQAPKSTVGRDNLMDFILAEAALTFPMLALPRILDSLRQRRDCVARLLNGIDGLNCDAPKAGLAIFANCGEVLGRRDTFGKTMRTDADLVNYLHRTAHTLVGAGSEFNAPDHIKIAFGGPEHALTEALARIQRALADLR